MPPDPYLIRSLRDTTAVIVHPDDEDRLLLADQLRRIGCKVILLWPEPGRLPPDADVVFFGVQTERDASAPWLGPDARRVVRVALVAYENPAVLEAVSAAGVHAVLPKPIRSFGVLATLHVARLLSRYEERLLSRIAKLDETLKTRRIVERAMRILSQRHSIAEDEAYALIRREAMRKQLSVAAMAESIVNAESIYLSPPSAG